MSRSNLARELARQYKADGPQQTVHQLREALAAKHLRPEDFSIRQLAEEAIEDGREFVRLLDPRQTTDMSLLETAVNVNTSAFSNITGQLVFSKILEGFNDPAFIWPDLVETVPTQFDGEKIPGIGRLGDKAESVGEGQPYPTAGLSEEWIQTPSTVKKGFMVPVTKEAVFFDRTGILLQRASEVGRWLGFAKEKMCIDLAIGATNNYNYKGTAIDTYGDNSGNHNWDNLAASNGITNWANIEAAELLFDGMTDPNTGEPILIMPTTIICCTAKRRTFEYILNAIHNVADSNNALDTAKLMTYYPNPVKGQYKILSNPLVWSRLSAASGANTTWFIGEPKRAFAWMENWDITPESSTNNSEVAFTNDIVMRYKASMRGVAAVLNPRYMVKNTA